MHGNVWEWCADWYGHYPPVAVSDPVGPLSGEVRVFRGGSWYDDPYGCRSGARMWGRPDYQDFRVGFRVVMEVF